jgi:hypothetical protein
LGLSGLGAGCRRFGCCSNGCCCGLLCTFKVGAWRRAVFTSGFCGWRRSCVCVQATLSILAHVVLAGFACTFAAVTAITVT